MAAIWPLSTRSRAVWACVVLIIATAWLTIWMWEGSSKLAYEFDSSPIKLAESLMTENDTSGRLAAWFPTVPNSSDPNAGATQKISAHNSRALRKLLGCMQADTCAENQREVVILEDHFLVDIIRGDDWIGGEIIWANSTVNALETLGYTYIFVAHWNQALFYHNLFPDLVTAIVTSPETLTSCWGDKLDCVKSPQNPNGLPIWKLLAFHFWADNVSPLDPRWMLSPEPWGKFDSELYPNTYLGYSIEERCTRHALVPADVRERRAYVLTKFLRFLVHNEFDGDPAWPPELWQTLVAELGMRFVVSIKIDIMPDGSEIRAGLPPGIDRLPQLEPDEFVDALAKSKVLIGVGNPRTSPTPYEALCMGVPFINPVMSWDESDPENTSWWTCQHDTLCRYGPGPPYVYNVKRGDRHAFLAAITAALDNPIERYIPEMMKQSSVAERLDAILRQDRLGMARELLRRRDEGLHQGELFVL